MLTTMTEEDWTIVLKLFEASRSRRGDKGRDDRKFLEALHYFVVHNITWRALPEKVRALEQRLETVLAIEPGRDIRGLFRCAISCRCSTLPWCAPMFRQLAQKRAK